MNKIKITADEKFQAQTFFNDDDDGGKYNLSEKELAECSFYKKGHTKVNIPRRSASLGKIHLILHIWRMRPATSRILHYFFGAVLICTQTR